MRTAAHALGRASSRRRLASTAPRVRCPRRGVARTAGGVKGAVAVTLLLPYEDAGEIAQRARKRREDAEGRLSMTQAILAEIGLGPEAFLVRADHAVKVTADASTIGRGWAASAGVITGS